MNDGHESAAGRLFALIGEHQVTIREALDDEQYAQLLARLEALTGVAPDDDRAVRRALRGVQLALLLPLPLGHPVRTELDAVRLVAAPPGPTAVAGARELMAALASPSPAPGTEGVAAGAQDELLRAPALSADEARARCGGAAPPPELIRLSDPGGDRYPEFQFAAGGGTPYEVVLEVNRLLLADIDPRGAAAWWFSGNTWLGGTPASLLGRLPDQQLVGAATALVEGD
ncbi:MULTISPECIES: hypothetical protein [unclassified Streptomyces]|uniref:hypothetical protein n=1 Tax=unclassified Streptomyces TaxID=2593676 RepID=UPI002E80CFED|nr:hypothetical protein [Streptomyces sp. NBC_00589]WTI35566.1 hypothetical protein OIC96_11440 [Streptomyces sp. NBC_00775]WUB30761.1 hypothetical protein OHA51_38290 [Streptomyces sp. NBC_00589]